MNRKTFLATFLLVTVAVLSLGLATTAGTTAASLTPSAKLCRTDADCGPKYVCCPRGYCGSPNICRL